MIGCLNGGGTRTLSVKQACCGKEKVVPSISKTPRMPGMRVCEVHINPVTTVKRCFVSHVLNEYSRNEAHEMCQKGGMQLDRPETVVDDGCNVPQVHHSMVSEELVIDPGR
jgi:hypothetical protein